MTQTPLSYCSVTAVPCSTCGGPSVRVVASPDGQYEAACLAHLDAPQQTALWVGDAP